MRHGRTGNGRAAASRYYGWTPLADKEKFFAVFPAARGSSQGKKARRKRRRARM